MFYVIYKITNQIDGKFYIGSHKTKDLNDNYMGSGKYLKRAQEKYGLENFKKEILFVFDTPEQMYAKEAEIVNEDFLVAENTYNLKKGGFGGWDYINSHENRDDLVKIQRWLEAGRKEFIRKIKEDIQYREKLLPKYRKNLEKANNECRKRYPQGTFFGKKHSAEFKEKMSCIMKDKQLGDKNSQFGTMWITNDIENKKIKKTDIIPEGWHKGRKCQ
jgi:hypothetical protein